MTWFKDPSSADSHWYNSDQFQQVTVGGSGSSWTVQVEDINGATIGAGGIWSTQTSQAAANAIADQLVASFSTDSAPPQ